MAKSYLLQAFKILGLSIIFSCALLYCSPADSPNEMSPDGKKNLELGQKAMMEKNVDQALEYFSKVIESDPDKKDGYYQRGTALLIYTKKAREAIFDLTKAIEIDSNFADAYNNRGLASSYVGAINSSLDDFDKAIKLDPNFTQAYVNRGSCFLVMKQYPQALQDFSKALDLEPNNPETYYQRGLTFYKKEEYDSAIADYSKSINIGYKLEILYQKRGNAYFRSGQFEKAIGDYEKVIEMNPQNYNARNNLAVSLDTTGNLKEAKVHRKFLAEAVKNVNKEPREKLTPIKDIKFKSFVSESGLFGIDLPEDWHVQEQRSQDNITLLITKEKLEAISDNYLVGAKLVLQTEMMKNFNVFRQDSVLEFWLGSALKTSEEYYDYQIFQKKTLNKAPYTGFIYKTLVQEKEDQVPLRFYEYVLAKNDVIFYAYLRSPDKISGYYAQIFDKAVLKLWVKDVDKLD